MAKKLQLTIPKPCHENWEQMTPVEQGRFCASCQKQVIDFTNMNDRQLATFFKKPLLSTSKDGSTPQNIQMITMPYQIAGEVVVVAGLIKPKKSKPKPAVSLLQRIFKDTAVKYFKVFPNPVSSSASLHIECKKMDDGYYSLQLLDQSGKMVYSKELWIDADARLLDIEMPSVSAGSYFLKLTNKKSGKKFTEKIIIE
jgi:hypothetical protein